MAVFKCKICGGDMELSADRTFGTCEYCGNSMTLPKLDDEQRAAAFNRGNHFRRIGEFDKALAVYERIVREDDTDAEAHWCCALCRFGIEYVEDPATYEWMPTCHRASFDSFLEDVDYKAAVEYSDGITRRQYIKDASKIAEVQRGILATSQSAQAYDVFICYKESDENGNRTRDSLMAQDIYYRLTEQGYKVFFSRITLEDVAGSRYEPYIFAALHSAKVMVVVGTKPEHLNAVWVRNEWSRFLAMMKKDHHKLLLSCYRDMDPYDMPEQLAVLQSYDMGKIGFIQDLIRGISKVLEAEKKPLPVKETIVVQQSAAPAVNIAPLLKRVFIFLEDGAWQSADEYCEKVLDMDPECAQAYLGKLMVELRVRKQENLKDCAEPFDTYSNYQKIIRYGSPELKATLAGYIEHIQIRKENDRMNGIYTRAVNKMAEAKTEKAYLEAANLFASIAAHRDSATLADECRKKAEEARREAREREERRRKDGLYNDAKRLMTGSRISNYQEAISRFEKICDWKDSAEQIEICRRRIAKLEAVKEQKAQKTPRDPKAAKEQSVYYNRKKSKIPAIVAAIVCVCVVIVIAAGTIGKPDSSVIEATEPSITVDDTDSTAASTEFDTSILESKYLEAVAQRDAGYILGALRSFTELGDFQDAKLQADALRVMYQTSLKQAGIFATSQHTLGLKNDGTVVAAGTESFLQSDISKWTDIVDIGCASSHVVGLKADGTVIAAGDDSMLLKRLSGWRDIVSISVGTGHIVGLKKDGTVVAAGYNPEGRCNVGDWEDIVAISAGGLHTVGLKTDGTVVATGFNEHGQCDVSGWRNIVTILARNSHTVGLKADGTVVATGLNDDSECNVSDWKDIIAISGSNNHTVGLKADGTVVATGYDSTGQCDVVSDWMDIIAISASSATVGLKADGTVVSNDSSSGVSEWKDIVAISVGESHVVGMKSDGTVVAGGYNGSGRCDVSGWTDIKVPVGAKMPSGDQDNRTVPLEAANVGDYVAFGAYEQDNNTSNGKEEIEWLVLDKQDNKVLVISKFALDCQKYNTSYRDVTWEKCSLRKWLNSDFVNSAFSANEKAMIPAVAVAAHKNPDYGTNPGKTTQDQVFLLSIQDTNKYFSADSARQCKPTAYAVASGAIKSNSGNCWWWLRSPGDVEGNAAIVYSGGGISEGGSVVNHDLGAVRPALWIDLNS